MNYVFSGDKNGGVRVVALEVLICEPDLLFSSRIESAAKRRGFEVRLVSTPSDLVQGLKEKTPVLVIVNLDAIGIPDALKELNGKRGCRFVGYYSHVNAMAAEKAKEAGLEIVVPRRAFVSKLNEVLGTVKSGG